MSYWRYQISFFAKTWIFGVIGEIWSISLNWCQPYMGAGFFNTKFIVLRCLCLENMTKYIEFMKQDCFVVNVSVFWLNKSVLTINNFIRGLTKFWKKVSYSQKKIFFCNSAPLILLKLRKNSCTTVFFSVNLPATLLKFTLKQSFFSSKTNTLPQLFMLIYNLINNPKYKDDTRMNVLHVTFSFSIYMIKSMKQLYLKYRFFLY